MLHFILGPAGSGKTHMARSMLVDAAKAGKDVLLIVPEQYSFETEKTVLETYGESFFAQLAITSFARLPDRIARQVGKSKGQRLDDTGRYILMNLALDDVKDQLTLLQGKSSSGELVQQLLDVSREMKSCAVHPNDLSAAARSSALSSLQEKGKEIALVLEAFDTYVQQSYLDPQDDLERLAEQLAAYPDMFRDAVIIVDSFHGFTQPENKILELLLRRCQDMIVTLCTDRLGLAPGDDTLFAPACHTAGVLRRMAAQNGISVAPPKYLTDRPRFHNEEMSCLEKGFFRTGPEPFDNEPEHIRLFRAAGRYEECMAAGALIRDYVQKRGWHYRDITVVVRDENEYQNALQAAFDQYEIPVFLDRPAPVESEPLMRLVLAAFDCVQYGFRTDDVLAVVKSGLLPLEEDNVARVENYVFLWDIRGKNWKKPWVRNPAGFVRDFSDSQKKELMELEACRNRIMEPLLAFSEKLKHPSGHTLCRAVYELLQDYQVETTLPKLASSLREGGRLEDSRLQSRLWNTLMEVLDQTDAALGEREIPPARYSYFLRQIFRGQDLSSIPQHMDEVTVSVAGRMRPGTPKGVLILGAVLGKFPRAISENGGMLSESERRELIRCGLELRNTSEEAMLEERLSAYMALCAASEDVVVSYPLWSGQEENSPSEIMTQLQTIFPKLRIENVRELPEAITLSSKETFLSQFALRREEHSQLAADLCEAAALLPECQEDVQAIVLSHRGVGSRIENKETARQLFWGQKISATQIETYYKCPFRYFCRYGLHIREPLPAQLNALQYGNLAHYVLEHVLPQLAENPSLEDNLQELVDTWMDTYAEETLGGLEEQTARFRALFRHYRVVIGEVARYAVEELKATDFVPTWFEEELGEGKVDTLKISLPNGGEMEVGGKIDRIDLCTLDGKTYVRIIDYKTGQKEFELSQMLSGMNLQMMLYLCAIVEKDLFTPAGILYMPIRTPKKEDAPNRMNGILVENDHVLTHMDHTYEENGKGTFIPVSKLKNGSFAKTSRIISESGLRMALAYTKSRVEKMAQELGEGNIQPDPLLIRENGCAYCPYYAVCEKEFGRLEPEKPKMSKEGVLQLMAEEMEGGSSHGNTMDAGPETGD